MFHHLRVNSLVACYADGMFNKMHWQQNYISVYVFFVIKNVSNNTNYLSSIKISQKRLPLYNGDSESLVTGRVF